jgi:hypothetical protein
MTKSTGNELDSPPSALVAKSEPTLAPTRATPEDIEPQNALTEQFNDDEWKALAQFRVSS